MTKMKVKDPAAAHAVLTVLDINLLNNNQGATKFDQTLFFRTITAHNALPKAPPSQGYHDARSIRDIMAYALRNQRETQFKVVKGADSMVALFLYGSRTLTSAYLDFVGYAGSSGVTMPEDEPEVMSAVAAAKSVRPPVILKLSPKRAGKEKGNEGYEVGSSSQAVAEQEIRKEGGHVKGSDSKAPQPPVAGTLIIGPSSNQFIPINGPSEYIGDMQRPNDLSRKRQSNEIEKYEVSSSSNKKRKTDNSGSAGSTTLPNQIILFSKLIPGSSAWRDLELPADFINLRHAIVAVGQASYGSARQDLETQHLIPSSPSLKLDGLLSDLFGNKDWRPITAYLMSEGRVSSGNLVQSLITAFLEMEIFQKSITTAQNLQALSDSLAEVILEILPRGLHETGIKELKRHLEEACKRALIVKENMDSSGKVHRYFRPVYGQRAFSADLRRAEDGIAKEIEEKTVIGNEEIVTVCHLPGLIRAGSDGKEYDVIMLAGVATMMAERDSGIMRARRDSGLGDCGGGTKPEAQQ